MDVVKERGRVSEGNRRGQLYTYYMIHFGITITET